jgi:hypothetical protein
MALVGSAGVGAVDLCALTRMLRGARTCERATAILSPRRAAVGDLYKGDWVTGGCGSSQTI